MKNKTEMKTLPKGLGKPNEFFQSSFLFFFSLDLSLAFCFPSFSVMNVYFIPELLQAL